MSRRVRWTKALAEPDSDDHDLHQVCEHLEVSAIARGAVGRSVVVAVAAIQKARLERYAPRALRRDCGVDPP